MKMLFETTFYKVQYESPTHRILKELSIEGSSLLQLSRIGEIYDRCEEAGLVKKVNGDTTKMLNSLLELCFDAGLSSVICECIFFNN
jgi:hypothetical protein